jgi:hypothetical protein
MSNLRTVIRIKTMAQAAAAVSDQPGPEEGAEMAAAYERLRNEARKLNSSAGWGDDTSFDAEVPPIDATPIRDAPEVDRMRMGSNAAFQAAAAGRRARVLLGQLAAWAAGHQETFELEESLKARAAAAAAEAKPRPQTGFGP